MLGKGWEESQNENMIKIRKDMERFKNAKTEKESDMLLKEFFNEANVEM